VPPISQEALARSATALQAKAVAEALHIRGAEQGFTSFDRSSVAVIEFTLHRTQTILHDCPAGIIKPLRVGAAMMELWGRNNIKDFVQSKGRGISDGCERGRLSTA